MTRHVVITALVIDVRKIPANIRAGHHAVASAAAAVLVVTAVAVAGPVAPEIVVLIQLMIVVQMGNVAIPVSVMAVHFIAVNVNIYAVMSNSVAAVVVVLRKIVAAEVIVAVLGKSAATRPANVVLGVPLNSVNAAMISAVLTDTPVAD